MLELIEKLGVKVKRDDHTVIIDPTHLNSFDLDPDLSSKFRASVVLAAPLLAPFWQSYCYTSGRRPNWRTASRYPFCDDAKKMGVEIDRPRRKIFFKLEKKKSLRYFS